MFASLKQWWDEQGRYFLAFQTPPPKLTVQSLDRIYAVFGQEVASSFGMDPFAAPRQIKLVTALTPEELEIVGIMLEKLNEYQQAILDKFEEGEYANQVISKLTG